MRSYAYDEAFAEKTRALAERARPRDLYDVVNLVRNVDARPTLVVLFDVLRQKCDAASIRRVLGRTARFFEWLTNGLAPRPPKYPTSVGEVVVRTRLVPFSASIPAQMRSNMQQHLDIIRFAASNRLCVQLVYLCSSRLIEPYSLRRTLEGNVVLHAHNRDKDAHRSYRVDRIQGARVTSVTFTPRFAIELTPSGPFSVLPTANRGSMPYPTRSTGVSMTPGRVSGARRRRRRPRSRSRGPTYVYQCHSCGKRFSRKQRTIRLNPHKDKNGYSCPARSAISVGTLVTDQEKEAPWGVTQVRVRGRCGPLAVLGRRTTRTRSRDAVTLRGANAASAAPRAQGSP